MTRRDFRVSPVTWFAIAGLILYICVADLTPDAVDRDYLQYWTAEQLLVHGANPYDPSATMRLELSTGMHRTSPLITYSPPVAFIFAYPLGLVSARTGLALWVFALFLSLLISVWLVWLLEGRPQNYYHLVGFFFPPVLWCFMSGQIGIFFLLDIVLFLYFHKSRPFVAGAALVLCSLKPHLFVPCFVVLVLWSIYKREFRVLAGFLIALAASCLASWSLDRQIWTQYAQLMRTSGIMHEFIPTVGVALRFLVKPLAQWIEFIPMGAACLWATWYFWSRRKQWEWMDQGLVLLAVAVACTPYSWYTDQSVLIPAVITGLQKSEKSGRALLLFVFLFGLGMISLMSLIRLRSALYVVTAPAWVVWYLYARRKGSRSTSETDKVAITTV